MKRDRIKRRICIIFVSAAVLLLLGYELILPRLIGEGGGDYREYIDMIVTRLTGGVACLTLLIYLGYRVMHPFGNSFGHSVLFCLPAMAVVINNLHIYTLLTGQERVTGDAGHILLLALECLCVGLFEEMTFRGVIFLGILEKRRNSTRGIFISILLSSAIFGGIHAINFIYGSAGAVIQQIGYSFLIGAMCSVVLLKTANIWLCVLLHATYNFCGALVPRLGEGYTWDMPTVIFTVILSVCVAVYYIIAVLRMRAEETDGIYEVRVKSEEVGCGMQ